MEPLSDKFETYASFTVFVPQNNGYSDPRMMGRITDHFKQMGLRANFKMGQDNLPEKDEDGAYTLVT